jgi:hypothetical protein
MKPRLWVELCAGSAAVALRLVGGPYANPPIGYMGGKRGYARAILGALGLRQGLGADEVWLSDPGPFGAVWSVLTQPGKAAEVARTIRGWSGEEPRVLWESLRAEGWGELTEPGEVAAWTICGAYSHVMDGEQESYALKNNTDGLLWNRPPEWFASRVEAVARWLVCDDLSMPGRPEMFAIQKAYDPPNGAWRGGKPWHPEQIASRLAGWPTPVRVLHGSALDVPIPEDCRGVYVYADPSYKHPDGTPTTGYARNIYAEDLRERLHEWSARGAVVAISDARDNSGLMGEGWTAFEIGTERAGQKRTFSRQQAEWLTLNRPPAWKPGKQEGLPWAR